jgi:hypothetical protein
MREILHCDMTLLGSKIVTSFAYKASNENCYQYGPEVLGASALVI